MTSVLLNTARALLSVGRGNMAADWRHDFIAFCLECEVLRFGEFTLKSGRQSPYFFNAGLFNTGLRLAKLGSYYAKAIVESKLEWDVLLGPAYKGIPLAAATSMCLATEHDIDAKYCFNRKEAKDHGEGGIIVGSPLAGRALVIDDVITAGTAARESAALVAAQGAELAGLVVALDREECGAGTTLTAIGQVEADLKVPVVSILTLTDLIGFLEAKGRSEDAARLTAHKAQFGAGQAGAA
jgi:orotate phosphoribosyltransferase